MNQYLTFHKIITEFQKYQVNSPILNSFGYGDLVYFSTVNTGNTATYPYMFITPQTISYDENITTYGLQVIFADRVNEDLSNQKDVVSDMSIEAKRFLSAIKRGIRTYTYMYNNFDITLPVAAIPFMERYNDHVGGVVLNLDLIIFEDINACDYYREDGEEYFILFQDNDIMSTELNEGIEYVPQI